MARRAPQPSLSPKLLKHFAAATVMIVASLALFADGFGENKLGREFNAEQRAAEQALTSAARARVAPVMGLNQKIRDVRHTYVPIGVEETGDSAYGQPMDGGSSGGGGGYSGGRSTPPNFAPIDPRGAPQVAGGPGFRPGEPPQGPRTASRPTREQLEQIEAASRARSGGSDS